MICRSNIRPFDIFFADKKSDFDNNFKHYYVCIYTQAEDPNNKLWNDIYGLIITTNQKYRNMTQNDYNVEIEINGHSCYVCCDKLVRMRIDRNVKLKRQKLSNEKIEEVKANFFKFIEEMKRQVTTLEVIP